MNIPEKFWKRLLEQINNNDYCPMCDCHPSHGHAEDCPAAEAK